MLSSQWPDRAFSIAALKDRNPVQEEDECVLLAAPDPQSAMPCRHVSNTAHRSPADSPSVGLGMCQGVFLPCCRGMPVGNGWAMHVLHSAAWGLLGGCSGWQVVGGSCMFISWSKAHKPPSDLEARHLGESMPAPGAPPAHSCTRGSRWHGLTVSCSAGRCSYVLPGCSACV